MVAETIVLLTNSTPVASGTDDWAGSRTLIAKNMSLFEPVNRLDSTCTSWTAPCGTRARVDVDLRGPVGAHPEVRAHDRPRPAAEDLDEVVVVVAVRAGERVVQIGIADHHVVRRTADDVGVADVVEADVVDDETPALGEDAGEPVLAVRELGMRDRDVAVVRIELERDPASSSAPRKRTLRNVMSLESHTSAIAG